MATMTLAQWASDLSLQSCPPSVRTAATRCLYNYIGCAIGASHQPTVKNAYEALTPFFGNPTSSLLGRSKTWSCDAQHAALLNGISSHVFDYDDTHLATIIHPTGPVASAILAYAEYATATSSHQTISGEQVLCALVAGIETSCKLGLSVWPTHYDIGWHITSTTGSIGAAVAVGTLMELGSERMAHAIGIAATQVIGLREHFGSDTKAFHPGRAAQSGLLAAFLAQSGFTSSANALEAKRGWANVVIGSDTSRPTLDQRIGELGLTWEIERNAFKPFPCGIVCHPAIDACIQLHAELAARGTPVQDITRVDERVHPLVIELTAKRAPKDGLEAKFSVFHGSAVGLLFGKAGPQEYTDDVVNLPEVTALRDKVDAEPDDSLRPDEVNVKVSLKDGGSIEKRIAHAVGSLEVPMTAAQLSTKFVDQVSLVLGADHARRASDITWSIGDAENVAHVLHALQQLAEP